MALYLLGYTLLSLLDTFFLSWIAQPHVAEPVHQLVIGGVKLQRTERGCVVVDAVEREPLDVLDADVAHERRMCLLLGPPRSRGRTCA